MAVTPAAPRCGILLVNLGTPDAPTPAAVLADGTPAANPVSMRSWCDLGASTASARPASSPSAKSVNWRSPRIRRATAGRRPLGLSPTAPPGGTMPYRAREFSKTVGSRSVVPSTPCCAWIGGAFRCQSSYARPCDW